MKNREKIELKINEFKKYFEKYGYIIPQRSIAPVGEGEQGRVVAAIRASIGKQFAVKIVVPRGSSFTDEEIKTFGKEVQCMAEIKTNDYVVPIVDQFDIPDIALCYVMEYIDGDAKNLRDRLKERRLIASEKYAEHMVDILWQIAQGLYYIHDAGIVHRDIKESNIMIKSNPLGGYRAIITDFGFGYRFSKGETSPPPAARKTSSYGEEARYKGLHKERVDHYCFGKMIHNLSDHIRDKSSFIGRMLRNLADDLTNQANKTNDEEIINRLSDIRRRSTIYRIDPTFASLLGIPELTDAGDGEVIRVAGVTSIPVTRRLLKIVDTEPFQRLKCINQLGSAHFVYPGAFHSRYEHSLGVFNLSRLVLRHLLQAESFLSPLNKQEAESFLLAALLHDIGQMPHSHDLEEMRLENNQKLYDHEKEAVKIIMNTEIRNIIEKNWKIEVDLICNLLERNYQEIPNLQILRDTLSSAFDIDMMDYLMRDSIHVGVPYGLSFDITRLLFSLTTNEKGNSIAITHKGIVPTEFFLIARYAMYTQVYQHHTVRSSVAMIQRAVWEQIKKMSKNQIAEFVLKLKTCDSETGFYALCAGREGSISHRIVADLSKHHRRIYKRWHQLPEILFDDIYRLSYPNRVRIVNLLTDKLKKKGIRNLYPWQVLLDMPSDKYQRPDLDVFFERDHQYHKIELVSPLIKSLRDEFERSTLVAQLFIENREIEDRIKKKIDNDEIDQMIKDAIEDLKQ